MEAPGEDLQSVAWTATLTLDGVSALRGLDRVLGEGWVVDERIVDAAGVSLEGVQTIGGAQVSAVEFTLNNGDKLSFDCERASLVLNERLEVVEGPGVT